MSVLVQVVGGLILASDYDNQLIESVTVRRNRLLGALLYGENPNERRWMDSVRLFLFSVAAAAVIAAVCVGYSFVSNLLEENRQKQEEQRRQQNSAPHRSSDPHGADYDAGPAGGRYNVAFSMQTGS
ncbi:MULTISPECIES: hypothetical protein [Arthrobacter]|uniref:Uncharacterized protein n=1 Tax=Arthrobacter jinronghuae TaxID=2964609 RepID=A0ABT1NU76_9MICC|nr:MULTISPECIES: hypothetical protein [Arthrobacter]MCQ1951136.1 hypothetical protein [Arthrobacter jinronghuae]MCQ1954448.1 hypothetical protein [Arthrobacter sp. zg-Y238]UWX79587.1 hypothetical protein N2K98_05130 [Arthrobacter jinronghuae]